MTPKSLTALDDLLVDRWNLLDLPFKRSFVIVLGINFLAFGFEMSNLIFHHDDVIQLFRALDHSIGYHMGRMGYGWIFESIQNNHYLPFLQLAAAIVAMTIYSLVICHLWGLKRTADIVLVSAVLNVFPYIAQIYTYDTATFPYALAHLLAALVVLFSIKGKFWWMALAVALSTSSFMIYQSVISNVLCVMWFLLLSKLLFERNAEIRRVESIKAIVWPLSALFLSGVIYLVILSVLGIDGDDYQATDKAFTFADGINLPLIFEKVVNHSRNFFFWPENYFPLALKRIQLLFLITAVVLCLWLPKTYLSKFFAITAFCLSLLAPFALLLLHPDGHYHNLTLSSYAVIIAGVVALVLKTNGLMLRNISLILGVLLVGGYLIQCNWIATVTHLNSQAHFSTMTQILSRLRAEAHSGWDGKSAYVVGSYQMRTDYPFKPQTGVATSFIDEGHLGGLARLMREDIEFIKSKDAPPGLLEYAKQLPTWPHPKSIAAFEDKPLIVLSHPNQKSK